MVELKIGNVPQAQMSLPKVGAAETETGFGEVLKGAVNSINHLEADADQKIVDMLQGKADIHESMIALQKADLSMRLFMKVRNKVVEAYREVMHMQF